MKKRKDNRKKGNEKQEGNLKFKVYRIKRNKKIRKGKVIFFKKKRMIEKLEVNIL